MSINRIYFMQHGIAVDKTVNPDRPLTELGIRQTSDIAHTLRQANVFISQIFHSGKLRASQTADIVASTLNVPTTAVGTLGPNDDVIVAAQTLTENNALYVGHLPQLAQLVSYLTGNNKNIDLVNFQNSAIICLEKTNASFYIQWFLIPELIMPDQAKF